jgi:O-antigen ligase
LLALNVLLLLAVIFSYARAAMLAVVFAAVVAVAIRLRLVNLIMPCLYGIIAIGMVYLVKNNNYIDLRPNYERTYMHRNFSDHLIATFKGQDMSSMERLYRWIAAVRMSNDRPIVGYGPHAFYYYYKPYTVNMFKTYVSRNEEHSTTHNYFLFMLVEQGWPAMLLYALLVMVVFAHAQRTYFSLHDRFYKYCTLGIAMAFAACFINNFFSEMIETHKVGSLFYVFITLLVILRRKSREAAALDKAG